MSVLSNPSMIISCLKSRSDSGMSLTSLLAASAMYFSIVLFMYQIERVAMVRVIVYGGKPRVKDQYVDQQVQKSDYDKQKDKSTTHRRLTTRYKDEYQACTDQHHQDT